MFWRRKKKVDRRDTRRHKFYTGLSIFFLCVIAGIAGAWPVLLAGFFLSILKFLRFFDIY